MEEIKVKYFHGASIYEALKDYCTAVKNSGPGLTKLYDQLRVSIPTNPFLAE
jgi:hypothetical protein